MAPNGFVEHQQRLQLDLRQHWRVHHVLRAVGRQPQLTVSISRDVFGARKRCCQRLPRPDQPPDHPALICFRSPVHELRCGAKRWRW